MCPPLDASLYRGWVALFSEVAPLDKKATTPHTRPLAAAQEHAAQKYNRVDCNPCPHGKLKHNCVDCSGCPHGKRKCHCVDCNPCPHGKHKRNCTACVGCEHGKRKSRCPACKAARAGQPVAPEVKLEHPEVKPEPEVKQEPEPFTIRGSFDIADSLVIGQIGRRLTRTPCTPSASSSCAAT